MGIRHNARPGLDLVDYDGECDREGCGHTVSVKVLEGRGKCASCGQEIPESEVRDDPHYASWHPTSPDGGKINRCGPVTRT